jgi:hypothetical protein
VLKEEVFYVKPDHKNKKPRHVAENHGTNFFHIKFLDRTNIKCQNRPVLPPAQVFYFNGQALYNMYNIVEEHFSISIAPVQSRGGSLVHL